MKNYRGYNNEHNIVHARMVAAKENHHNKVNGDHNQYHEVGLASKIFMWVLGIALAVGIVWVVFIA